MITSLSTDKILTLSYEPGDDLETLASDPRYSQDTRNTLGTRLFEALGKQMFALGEVHCDPHPGNFAFRANGSIVMYDFGATKRIPDEDLDAMRELMQAAYQQDFSALDKALTKLEVRNAGSPAVDDAFYARWIDLLLPPLADQPFDFTRSRLHLDLVSETRKTPWRYLESFQPSPRTLLINRVFGGHYWTMVKLGVNTSFRQQVDEALQR